MKTSLKIKIPRDKIADRVFLELKDYTCITILDLIVDSKWYLKKEIPSPYVSEISHEALECFYIWYRVLEENSKRKLKENYIQLIMRTLGSEYCG